MNLKFANSESISNLIIRKIFNFEIRIMESINFLKLIWNLDFLYKFCAKFSWILDSNCEISFAFKNSKLIVNSKIKTQSSQKCQISKYKKNQQLEIQNVFLEINRLKYRNFKGILGNLSKILKFELHSKFLNAFLEVISQKIFHVLVYRTPFAIRFEIN